VKSGPEKGWDLHIIQSPAKGQRNLARILAKERPALHSQGNYEIRKGAPSSQQRAVYGGRGTLGPLRWCGGKETKLWGSKGKNLHRKGQKNGGVGYRMRSDKH